MTPAAARKHYLDSRKAFDAQELSREHADKLRGTPPKAKRKPAQAQ